MFIFHDKHPLTLIHYELLECKVLMAFPVQSCRRSHSVKRHIHLRGKGLASECAEA